MTSTTKYKALGAYTRICPGQGDRQSCLPISGRILGLQSVGGVRDNEAKWRRKSIPGKRNRDATVLRPEGNRANEKTSGESKGMPGMGGT